MNPHQILSSRLGEDGLAVLLAMLFAGLGGGVGHCVGMCGPFVIAQVGARAGIAQDVTGGMLARLRGAALLPYQCGRFASYTLLGALAGGLADFVLNRPGLRLLLAAMLALAAGLTLAQALGLVRNQGGGWIARAFAAVTPAVEPLQRDPRGLRGFALGVALGFLPCGLLYAALAAAAGTGTALGGAAAMGAFVLGTMPALIGVGWAGAFFARRFQGLFARVAPMLLLVAAAMLLWTAWQMLPLSP